MDRLTNLIGALAVAVGDAQGRAMQAEGGLSASGVALLLLIDADPGASIATAAAVVGLTHSATVRLAADLADRGLVARGAGADRRVAALTLTPAGVALVARLRAARAGVLSGLTAALDPADRAAAARAVTAMLCRLARDRRTTDHLCRFCDEAACGGPDCPVERHTAALP